VIVVHHDAFWLLREEKMKQKHLVQLDLNNVQKWTLISPFALVLSILAISISCTDAVAGDCQTVCSGGSCTSECPSESVAPPPASLPATVACRTARGVCSFNVSSRLPQGTPCHCGSDQGLSE
jgi:hypothetical protein